MNKKIILAVVGGVAVLGGLIGVRIAVSPTELPGTPISLYVGNESGNVKFYQKLLNKWVQDQRAKGGEEAFPYVVKVSGVDLGSIASSILKDNTAHADIISVAADNVGKLVENGKVHPFQDASLISQVKADNSESFASVCDATAKDDDGKPITGTYAAPYISQALFLMYDTRKVTAEEAKTFEALQQAAKRAGNGVYAVEAVGTDGYNFSFPILARTNDTQATSVKIYADGTNSSKEGTFFQGDDTIAVTRWTQRYYDEAALRFPTDAGWTLDIQGGTALSIIGGAWHYNAFASAVGSANVGVAPIPTFTITDKDAYGAVTAGTVYRGGSFVDPKVMMVNRKVEDEVRPYAERVIKYLSSIEAQNESFALQGNIPAYEEFADNIDDVVASYASTHPVNPGTIAIAKAQGGMTPYGIAQPFLTAKLNNYYYQNGAPSVYQEIIVNKGDEYDTVRKIQEGLFVMQYIWQNGKRPTNIAAELPAYCRDDNGKTINYDASGQPVTA